MIILIICYIILFLTALFNEKIVETQDYDDDQSWHIYQLLQWLGIYGAIAYLSGKWLLVIGFGLTYPFFYDGILSLLMNKNWVYLGDPKTGARYTISAKIKIISLITGIILIIMEL